MAASPLSVLLHKLGASLIIAGAELERGDESAAAETIEKASLEIREEISK